MMKLITSATVTLDDLYTYFRGDHWKSDINDGKFEAWSESGYHILLSPKSTQYAVEVHAYEDSSDSDSEVTDNPTQFLVDFLKTGTIGDEAFEKMAGSFSPDDVATLLRRVATFVETESIGPRAMTGFLRRTIAGMKPQLAAGREEYEKNEINHLMGEMKKKGWRPKLGEGKAGLPMVTVDIAGVYEAKIEVDHISWDYMYEVPGTEMKEEGLSEDPIAIFRKFMRDPSVQEARKSNRRVKEEKAIDADEINTKPAPRNPT